MVLQILQLIFGLAYLVVGALVLQAWDIHDPIWQIAVAGTIPVGVLLLVGAAKHG